jgi:hypothetical protein
MLWDFEWSAEESAGGGTPWSSFAGFVAFCEKNRSGFPEFQIQSGSSSLVKSALRDDGSFSNGWNLQTLEVAGYSSYRPWKFFPP